MTDVNIKTLSGLLPLFHFPLQCFDCCIAVILIIDYKWSVHSHYPGVCIQNGELEDEVGGLLVENIKRGWNVFYLLVSVAATL